MERELSPNAIQKGPGKMFLRSLVLSRFALQPPILIATLLLVDISHTYNQPVAITGQIRTIAALIAAFSAILVSIWGLRFRSQSLDAYPSVSDCINLTNIIIAYSTIFVKG